MFGAPEGAWGCCTAAPSQVLRGGAAARFLSDVEGGDPQELMARVTGNYRHGNERTAKQHPRTRR
jgi:hypothetical protein